MLTTDLGDHAENRFDDTRNALFVVTNGEIRGFKNCESVTQTWNQAGMNEKLWKKPRQVTFVRNFAQISVKETPETRGPTQKTVKRLFERDLPFPWPGPSFSS